MANCCCSALHRTLLLACIGALATTVTVIGGVVAGAISSATTVVTAPSDAAERRADHPSHVVSSISPLATRIVVLLSGDEMFQAVLEHFGPLLHEWWVEEYGEEPLYAQVSPPTRSRECLDRCRYLISTTVDPPRRAGRQDITAESTPTPYWLDPQLGFDAEQGAFWMFQLTDAVGWPFRAARSSLMLAPISTVPPHHAAEVRGGIALFPMEDVWSLRNPSPTEWAWSQWRAIPLDPIWPGLLLDVVFWAATLGVLFYGSGAARRGWRRANGRCRGCGHIMHGVAVCPECGEAAAQRPADPLSTRAQN